MVEIARHKHWRSPDTNTGDRWTSLAWSTIGEARLQIGGGALETPVTMEIGGGARRNSTENVEIGMDFGGTVKIEPVADCSKKDFTDQKRVEMSVSKYIDYCLGISINRHEEVTNRNDDTEPLLYLKDWHFVKEHPNYVAYTTPLFFVDDWLNIYLDSHSLSHDSDITKNKTEINCSDYRFIYMGVKGTWTPLHADVFRSYSWSANVCGKKQWHFLPPSQCHLIFDRYQKSSAYDVHGDISEKKFPGFNKAIWWECTQEQNEIIFVPSGWYHQVHNLEDTISINHNWFNGHNLSWVWKLLVKDYNEAKEYIEDIRDICDDFESICQRNLAANTGMNFYDFFAFLTRFALANMALLRDLEDEDFFQSRSISYHVINNMHAIHSVASSMGSVEAFAEENSRICPDENCDAKRIMEGPDFRVLCADLGTILKDMCAEHHQDDGMGRKIPHRTDLSSLLDFKIRNPAELVKLIELAIPDHFNACEFKAHDV